MWLQFKTRSFINIGQGSLDLAVAGGTWFCFCDFTPFCSYRLGPSNPIWPFFCFLSWVLMSHNALLSHPTDHRHLYAERKIRMSIWRHDFSLQSLFITSSDSQRSFHQPKRKGLEETLAAGNGWDRQTAPKEVLVSCPPGQEERSLMVPCTCVTSFGRR